MSVERPKVAICPPGKFGTALGVVLAVADKADVVFCFRTSEGDEIFRETGENRKHFPGQVLPNNITSTRDPEEALHGADVMIFATQARYSRTYFEEISPYRDKKTAVLSIIKGLEEDTAMRMSEVIRDIDPRVNKRLFAAMSGPNFAWEIIKGLQAATVIASENGRLAEWLQKLFKTSRFLPFRTDDVIGVELGGALKNPEAMMVGICDGLGLGNSASAALANRSSKEMTRLIVLLGGDERTAMGLAGDGDFDLSRRPGGRNYDTGVVIGRGEDPRVFLNSKQTIEGLYTIKPALASVRKHGAKAPMLEGLYGIIYEGREPARVMDELIGGDFDYEDPQTIIHRNLRIPLRALNRLAHLWGSVS